MHLSRLQWVNLTNLIKKLKSLTYFSNAQNGIFDFSFHFLCGAIVQVVSWNCAYHPKMFLSSHHSSITTKRMYINAGFVSA